MLCNARPAEVYSISVTDFIFNLRSLDYSDDMEKKPSHMEMVTVQATAGMLAGACSSVITTPIDTVKTRLQVYPYSL